jgi:formate dehydrogenase major subunit
VYTTFHYPSTGANVVTTENADWATSCPEYKVTAVQIAKASARSRWQEEFRAIEAEQNALVPRGS